EHAFDEADVRLLQTLASSMSVAMENARLFDETQRLLKETEARNAELALINTVQRALAGELNLQAVYDAVGEQLRQVFPDFGVGIRRYDPATGLMHFPYLWMDGRSVKPPVITPSGFGAEVLRTRKTLLTDRDFEAVARRLGAVPLRVDRLPKSQVLVPMFAGDRIIGMFDLYHDEREQAFSEADIRLLETLAASTSVALENARLFDETQRLLKETEARNAELAVINAVQDALAGQLDMHSIYVSVGDKVREAFGNERDLQVRVVDVEAGTMAVPYRIDRGQSKPIPTARLGGFTAKVISERRTLLINRRHAELSAEVGSQPLLPGGEAPKSQVLVPVLARGQVRVVLSMRDLDHEDAFSAADVRLLETLAASMGAALENARLFAETQRLLKETEARNAELAVINEIQQGVAAQLDFDSIVQLVGDTLRRVLDTGDLSIRWLSDDKTTRRTLYAYEHGQRLPPGRVWPVPESLRRVVEHRETLVFNSVAEQISQGLAALPGTDQARSMVVVPMVASDRVVGMLNVEDHQRDQAFGPGQVRLVQTVAASMGAALENARLFDETQRLLKETEARNAELAVINAVQEALAGKLSLEEIYVAVSRELGSVFRDCMVGIRRIDPTSGLMTIPDYGDLVDVRSQAPRPPFGFAAEVLRTRSTLVINHQLEAVAVRLGSTSLITSGRLPKSQVLVPMMLGGQVFGIVDLFHMEREEAFSAADVRLLETIAASAVVALENARLVAETQQALERQTATAEILQVIARSPDSVEPVFSAIVDCARRLLHGFSATLFRVQGNRLKAVATTQASQEVLQILQSSSGMSIDAPYLVDCIRLGVVTQVSDVQTDPRYADDRSFAELRGYRSVVYAPLLREGEVLGLIGVTNEQPGLLPARQIELLQTFASQAVIAIENARLFNETQEALEQQTASAEVLQVISGSPTDVQPVFDRIVTLARNLGQAEGALLFRLEGGALQLAAFCRNDGDWGPQMSLGQRVALTRGSVAARAVMTRNASLIEDTLLDPDYDAGMAYGARRVYSVPLLRDGEPIGAINLAWREPGSVPASVQRIIPTFASQAVI
ncbi:MAG: GAF domain-containing protein, partial [Roseateles sp.]